VDSIVKNFAVFRIDGYYPAFCSSGYKIVPGYTHHTVVTDILGPVGIAKADTCVTVNNNVALNDAILSIVPDKDRPAPLASPAVYAYKNVIAYCPAFGIHHVNPADVVSVECLGCVGFVIGESFRPVVIEKAVLNPAILRPNRLAVLFRNLDSLDTPLPDVVNNAIVYGQVMNSGLGVDFEAVPLDVLDRQISNRHT
jgi:hypothetical protein